MGGIYPFDLPGVPENRYFIQSPYTIPLESFVEMPSKPYPRPALVQQTAVANLKWIGYYNQEIPLGRSDDHAVIVPKIPINRYNFNAPVPYMTGAAVAGQAPVRGIFTGVQDEVTPCR